ncbi:MAG: glycosyltransferase family 39 protein, partial [Candidatus Moranbacteria bacterium]|nr:glycosyltransferase family 39 protein [Candidatus Moranbacteria bacterium]
MEYLKQFIKKNWIIITLAIIIAGAIFIRTYNFSEWLYFKSDQVRDAKLAYEAFQNGPGELPLLGPRAAGTYLRLGPIFYYFQYFSAKLFNSVEPAVFAYPDLFFSILTIPLLFIFAGKFFSRKTSLMITALYAFSFIIVQYSRFGWNPNSLPFWGLLFILSIYNASIHKDNKKAGWFLVLAGLAYAVVSQLHFIALVGFPIIAFLFGIFYFPRKINWKYWLGALAVIAFFYIPVILSDVKTGGDNWDQF